MPPPEDHRCLECFRGPEQAKFAPAGDGWSTTCKTCEKKLEVVARQEEEHAQVTAEVGKLVRATVRKSHLPEWKGIAADLLQKLGGPDGLVDLIYTQTMKVLDDPASSAGNRHKMLQFITKVIQAGMEERSMDLEVSRLSEQELHAGITAFLERSGHLRLVREPDTDGESDDPDNPYD